MTWLACRGRVLLPGVLLLSCAQPTTTGPSAPATPGAANPPVAPKTAPIPAVKPGTITEISITGFFPLQEAGEALIYDVRPAFFHVLGHIPGSISWPKSKFTANLATHEPEILAAVKAGHPVVLYCTDRECPDSLAVAKRLAALGHSVAILGGGYDEWKAAGLPTG